MCREAVFPLSCTLECPCTSAAEWEPLCNSVSPAPAHLVLQAEADQVHPEKTVCDRSQWQLDHWVMLCYKHEPCYCFSCGLTTPPGGSVSNMGTSLVFSLV